MNFGRELEQHANKGLRTEFRLSVFWRYLIYPQPEEVQLPIRYYKGW